MVNLISKVEVGKKRIEREKEILFTEDHRSQLYDNDNNNSNNT